MIKPTKYPYNPDEMAELFNDAANQGKQGKQDTLVSGTNIKTINGSSVLGSGDLTVSSATSWGGITGTLSSQNDLNTALNAKQDTITAGTTAQYYRGDKTFQTLNKTAVGLGNVDNTSDASKPISTATQTALDAKQSALVSGTSIKTVNSTSLLGSGDVAVQPTLVSGTNIKTVNGTSLLGSGDVSTGPKLLGFKGILGTSAGTSVTTCHSVLIPANTLTTNSILQLIFRMYRVTGNVGQVYGRIYFNTTNSLTGASLFPTVFTMNGASTQFMGLVERNFAYNGTTLTSYSNTAFSDYTTGTALTVTLNRTVDNYVLFTMQCQNSADLANIDLVKVFAYV